MGLKNGIYIIKQTANDRNVQLRMAKALKTADVLDSTGYTLLLNCAIVEDGEMKEPVWVEADIWKSYDKDEKRLYYTVHLLFSESLQQRSEAFGVSDSVYHTQRANKVELSALLDELANDLICGLRICFDEYEFVVVEKWEDYKKLPISAKYLRIPSVYDITEWEEDGIHKYIVPVNLLDVVDLDCTVKDNGFVALMDAVGYDGEREVMVSDCISEEQRNCIEQFVADEICRNSAFAERFATFIASRQKNSKT